MSNNNFNNQTEFVLSQDLAGGFTVLNNNILNCGLSFNAIGLYSTIIQKAYIPGWKVYQATLINSINKKAAVSNGIKELIEFGLIIKEQLRENGRIKGVKYIINATPTRYKDYVTGEFTDNVGSIENTAFPPKAEKQKSVKQKSVKQPLINKEEKKERTLKKKDITTTKEKVTTKNSSSSSININLDIKGITKTNIKRLNLNQEQIDLLENYVAISEYENLDKFCYYIAKQIKNELITEKDLAISKKVSKKKKGTGLSSYFEKDKSYYEKVAKEEQDRYFDDFDEYMKM